MSTTAINAGLTAASAANNVMAQEAAHRARVDRCTIFESRFDIARASVAEKQEYASCVETLYPTPTSEGETYLIKGCIVVVLLALVIGAVHGYKEFRDLSGAFLGSVMWAACSAGALIAIGLLIAGVGYLFS